MSDLRGILGDRYDDVIEKTARHMHTLEWMGVEEDAELAWDHYPALGPTRQEYLRWAEAVLSFVVPGLLTAERERADVAEAKAARYAWIIRQYAEADRVRCGWCGARPADPVEIDGIRYCNHKDSPSPTCYELAVQRKGHLAAMSEYDEGEPINPVGIR